MSDGTPATTLSAAEIAKKAKEHLHVDSHGKKALKVRIGEITKHNAGQVNYPQSGSCLVMT
jgi:hypothetical protein